MIDVDPTSREILTTDLRAVFKYPQMPSSAGRGTLVYGLHSDNAALPYYSVEYSLGDMPPEVCAPGTLNLLRAESKDNDPPVPANRKPIINCVVDFQVSFGLDTDGDGLIDLWDPAQKGVFELAKYDIKTLRKRIKQVRVYLLVQNGNFDPDFTYSNPDDEAAPDTVCVGDRLARNRKACSVDSEAEEVQVESSIHQCDPKKPLMEKNSLKLCTSRYLFSQLSLPLEGGVGFREQGV